MVIAAGCNGPRECEREQQMTTHMLNAQSVTVVGNTLKCYPTSWASLERMYNREVEEDDPLSSSCWVRTDTLNEQATLLLIDFYYVDDYSSSE